jgi:hypothetical protein
MWTAAPTMSLKIFFDQVTLTIPTGINMGFGTAAEEVVPQGARQ